MVHSYYEWEKVQNAVWHNKSSCLLNKRAKQFLMFQDFPIHSDKTWMPKIAAQGITNTAVE